MIGLLVDMLGVRSWELRKVVDDMWIGEDGKLGNVESGKHNGLDEME